MTDPFGPPFIRATDSWSCTEVRFQKHTHSWTVKGFSQCDSRYLETMVKPIPTDSSLVFRIRIHPQGNKESNKDFTFFQVFCSNSQCRHRAKFQVFNNRNEEISTTIYNGQQQLHGYFEYIRRQDLLSHLLPSDELILLLDLTVNLETVTKSDNVRQPQIEPRQHEVTKDLEKLFLDENYVDFTIVCNGRKISCHKAILAARSPVFAAMLEPHTEEAQQNSVTFDDLDYEVIHEMLNYMYTGSAPNIKEMAAELLAAGDRFHIAGLKETAEQVLRHNLNIENSCRVLIMADMHGAKHLKQEAVRFIAQHKSQVIKTDGWEIVAETNPSLITEIVSAIHSGDQACTSSTSPSSSEPASKRVRNFASLTQ